VRALVLVLLLAACGRPDCKQAVAHGMDLAAAELDRSLAKESPAWQARARDDAKRARDDALAKCGEGKMSAKTYDCTMAAKTYAELLKCPGWR
jgi:hypothetical protein